MMSKLASPAQNYRDKKLGKAICRVIYYFGLGDCWYEPMQKSRMSKYLYMAWCLISNLFLVFGVLSQLLSFTIDLTPQEMNDCLQLSFGCSCIMLKLLIVFCRRSDIKGVLKKLLEDTRIPLTTQTEAAVVKRTKNMVLFLAMTMWLCLGLTTIDSIRLYYNEGVPIRTLVTLWPRGSDVGPLAGVARFVIQVHWWHVVTIMVVCDSVCVMAFVLLRFKFRTLQTYFKGLRRDFLQNANGKTTTELEDDYVKGFIFGVKLHSETLWCASQIQSALGYVYSIQIVHSTSLLAMCLVKLAAQDRSLTTLLANASFILVMLVLTGNYMMASGDVTHEASLVPAAMFASGWDLCGASAGRRVRISPLLVLALQRSQAPVTMAAFGILEMSYANFISVLRASYSFFTVTY